MSAWQALLMPWRAAAEIRRQESDITLLIRTVVDVTRETEIRESAHGFAPAPRRRHLYAVH